MFTSNEVQPMYPSTFTPDFQHITGIGDAPGTNGAFILVPALAGSAYGVVSPGDTAPNSQTNSSPNPQPADSGVSLLGIAVILWFIFK